MERLFLETMKHVSHMSIAVHAFPMSILTSFSVDEILLHSYVN